MAYVPSTVATRDLVVTEKTVSRRRGFFRWLADAIMLSRQRQAEREIARYLSGGKFTDETEREIERRFLTTPPRF
jgi:DNA primase catalytic subunit